MATLRSRCGHYIFAPWFLLSSSFFPRLISAVGHWMSTILHTWCGLSANLGCRSETCCTRLTENTGHKKLPKIRRLSTIVQLCRAIMSPQLRHISTVGKNFLSSNISSRCPHNMVNFGPLAAEIGPVVWGTPANFNGFHALQRYCMVLQQWGVSQTLRRWTEAPHIFGRVAITFGILVVYGKLEGMETEQVPPLRRTLASSP